MRCRSKFSRAGFDPKPGVDWNNELVLVFAKNDPILWSYDVDSAFFHKIVQVDVMIIGNDLGHEFVYVLILNFDVPIADGSLKWACVVNDISARLQKCDLYDTACRLENHFLGGLHECRRDHTFKFIKFCPRMIEVDIIWEYVINRV